MLNVQCYVALYSQTVCAGLEITTRSKNKQTIAQVHKLALFLITSRGQYLQLRTDES